MVLLMISQYLASVVATVLYFWTASVIWRRVPNWIPITINVCAGLQVLLTVLKLASAFVMRLLPMDSWMAVHAIRTGLAWPAVIALPIAVLGLGRYVRRIVDIREEYEVTTQPVGDVS